MADLVIKISGDVKNYEDALEKAHEKTQSLENTLESLGKKSAVAFASLTAEVVLSAKAFGESQLAANKLTQSLAQQGIYSEDLMESYKRQAKELENLTGVDDDAILKADALLQGMIGQQEITEPLTKAILDLAAAKGQDLESTTQLIGKGIAGHTAALQKLGITVDEHVTKQERTAQIIAQVNAMYGNQAEAANKGLAGIKGLTSAFGDFQEEIGARFAPILEVIIQKTTRFFQGLAENKVLLDLITSLITAGTVVTGLGVAIGAAGYAFLQLKAALAAAEIATSAMSIATKGLVGATGLGLLVLLGTEIYLNWSSIWPKMQAVYAAFVTNITDLSSALGKIFRGTFSLDLTLLKEGLNEAKETLETAYQEIQESTLTHEEAKAEIKNQAQTQEQINEAAHQELMLQSQMDFQNLILANEQAYQELSAQQKELFKADSQSKLIAQLETEKSIRNTYAAQQVQQDIKRRNQFLLDEQQFGTAYATINRAMNSDVYQGSKKAFGELGALVQSKNATLKTIGKAAAIANIVIKTAEAAMNIYSGFSLIPFVGQALGIAGAAAAIAFGAEQIANVTAAAEGGLITGGIPNVDSVPVLAQQGELVVPKQNFEEVVTAVSAQRGSDGEGGGGFAHIMISLKDDLMEFIDAKLIERERLNISLQGTA